jgi:hypothetical protein
MSVWICKVADVTTPGRFPGWLDDPAVNLLDRLQDLINLILALGIVSERETRKARPVRIYGRILRKFFARIQGEYDSTHGEESDISIACVDVFQPRPVLYKSKERLKSLTPRVMRLIFCLIV